MDENAKNAALDPELELQEEQESLIEYPCDFPIKVVGVNEPSFINLVAEIAKKHDPKFTTDCLQTRHSSSQKYMGVTLMIYATSREQLDNLYRELHALEGSKYVL